MQSLLAKDKQYVWHPFTPQKSTLEMLPVKRAKGCVIELEDGRKIIDAISSWWVNTHGHSNEYIADALSKQARTLEHVIFAGFTHEPAITLSERLINILPSKQAKVFFSDNGSTSTEVAMKMALQYFWNKQEKNRKKIVAIDGSYHGDTFGAMSAGDRNAFSAPFAPYLFDVSFIPFPGGDQANTAIEAFEALAKTGEVAAFIYEPLVQGSAGMRMYTPETLNTLIKIAHKYGVLCIADEVMTGFGRTGKYFSSLHMEEQPDIMCLSKGLTGGTMALGLTTCTQEVYEAYLVDDIMKTFFHGHSFTGNPLACAVANASLDLLLSEECQSNLRRIEERHAAFAEKAKGFKNACNIRQRGTILALDFDTQEESSYFNQKRDFLYETCISKGVLLRPLGNVIYVLPPYVITDEELEQVYGVIEHLFNL
ncbi:adenosylmethionine--8-amino-7-oxononanoate transaminase [Algivirga pacifica]|uniref:Adenosylmethionine-8-amino-7-oxononanoate aminotransferase n=1 Tax=Algivirga pacifica TaxID=1162670 RepID=A0ABP9DEP9_9BACT